MEGAPTTANSEIHDKDPKWQQRTDAEAVSRLRSAGSVFTYGRVPKSGVVPLGHSLDSVGPMARSAYDCALLLEVIAGYHASDPTSAKAPVEKYTGALTGNVEGLRIGVPEPYFLDHEQLDNEVRDGVLGAVDRLVGMGAVSSRFELPDAELAKDARAGPGLVHGPVESDRPARDVHPVRLRGQRQPARREAA